MEETVWLYFGIISVLVAIGIIASVVMTYTNENTEQVFFDSITHLREQADVVCDAPRDTMLSISIVAPADAVLTADSNRICARLADDVRCVATKCELADQVVLNLTNTSDLFASHRYTCTVLHAERLEISCAG